MRMHDELLEYWIVKIIMLKSLALIPEFCVSRSKTLLKRRKIKVKKRTVSDKMLADEAKNFVYAREYKAYQIQRELDRKTHPSHHLNELMDQLFYPDITNSDPQTA